MARPLKSGLDYFPVDTHFDEKIQALESVFKNDGLVWIIKFWQLAYRTNDGEVSLDGYHGVIHGENSRVTLEKQNEILKLCLEIGLLTKTDTNKYTSNGIKKRLDYVLNERNRWRIKHKIEVTSQLSPEKTPEKTSEKCDKVKESKVKESKEYKYPYLSNKPFNEVYKQYLQMRVKIGKPATPYAEELVLAKLHKFPLETALGMLEQSILNSWQGVFPLKQSLVERELSKPMREL